MCLSVHLREATFQHCLACNSETMLHPGAVDETLFVQILHAYSVRNPLELILDDAYDACLERMRSGASFESHPSSTAAELHQRFGAKLFVKERNGETVLVAGTKKRNLELIPLRRVYATLQQFAQAFHENPTQLKQSV